MILTLLCLGTLGLLGFLCLLYLRVAEATKLLRQCRRPFDENGGDQVVDLLRRVEISLISIESELNDMIRGPNRLR